MLAKYLIDAADAPLANNRKPSNQIVIDPNSDHILGRGRRIVCLYALKEPSAIKISSEHHQSTKAKHLQIQSPFVPCNNLT